MCNVKHISVDFDFIICIFFQFIDHINIWIVFQVNVFHLILLKNVNVSDLAT